MLIDEMLSGAPEEMPPAATAALSALQGTRLAWMVFATVLLAAAALAIPAMRYLRETPPTALPAMRVDINTPQTPQPLQFRTRPMACGWCSSRLGTDRHGCGFAPWMQWPRRHCQGRQGPASGLVIRRPVGWLFCRRQIETYRHRWWSAASTRRCASRTRRCVEP